MAKLNWPPIQSAKIFDDPQPSVHEGKIIKILNFQSRYREAENQKAEQLSIAVANANAPEDGAVVASRSPLAISKIGSTKKWVVKKVLGGYANEKLLESGALNAWSSRHARHFLQIFQQAEQLVEARLGDGCDTFCAVHLEDLRAAISWGVSPDGDAELAVDLTIASIPLSMELGLLEEWLPRVNTALAWLLKNRLHTSERAIKLHVARGVCLLCHTTDQQTGAAFRSALELTQHARNVE